MKCYNCEYRLDIKAEEISSIVNIGYFICPKCSMIVWIKEEKEERRK